MLNVLKVHVIDRKDLIALLQSCPMGIWIWHHLSKHLEQNQDEEVNSLAETLTKKVLMGKTDLWNKYTKLGGLSSTDIEAQLCTGRLF